MPARLAPNSTRRATRVRCTARRRHRKSTIRLKVVIRLKEATRLKATRPKATRPKADTRPTVPILATRRSQ